jgi:hypothetical protein
MTTPENTDALLPEQNSNPVIPIELDKSTQRENTVTPQGRTEKQAEASRINGRKGGVKTTAGKMISSTNARRHGLRAEGVLIQEELYYESSEELEDLTEALRRTYEPTGPLEDKLLKQIAWFQIIGRRPRVYEKTIITQRMHEAEAELTTSLERLSRLIVEQEQICSQLRAKLEVLRKIQTGEISFDTAGPGFNKKDMMDSAAEIIRSVLGEPSDELKLFYDLVDRQTDAVLSVTREWNTRTRRARTRKPIEYSRSLKEFAKQIKLDDEAGILELWARLTSDLIDWEAEERDLLCREQADVENSRAFRIQSLILPLPQESHIILERETHFERLKERLVDQFKELQLFRLKKRWLEYEVDACLAVDSVDDDDPKNGSVARRGTETSVRRSLNSTKHDFPERTHQAFGSPRTAKRVRAKGPR